MLDFRRFLLFFVLLGSFFLLVGCAVDEPMPTPTAVIPLPETPTQTPPPSATSTIKATKTAVATITLPSIPTTTPIYLPLASMTPFPTVTPDYDAPEPKSIFLFFGEVGGDGNHALWRHSPSLIIYSDGQIIFGDKENRPYSFLQTYLDPSQMCDLKREVQKVGFLEPPELEKYYTQTETGVGASHFIVQLENTYYFFMNPISNI